MNAANLLNMMKKLQLHAVSFFDVLKIKLWCRTDFQYERIQRDQE
jgi:hypothetical protein